VIQAALENHPLREHHVIQPDEVQVLRDKIALLVQHGADVNGKGDMQFPPIFNLLTLNLDLSPVLTFLIEKGADVNARSPNPMYPDNHGPLPKGLTPLMLAVIDHHWQYVDILLQHGADKTARDESGHTALDYAREEKADEAKLRLLR
jgi:ankyrin repeat protein